MNFVLLFSNVHTTAYNVHTEIGSDRFHLLSAVSSDSASLSIANGAEIREIKIDH